MDIFAKKKQAEALRAEIKQYIQFAYGQSAWDELLHIEAQVRKDRQKTMYRKAEIKQTIVEWALVYWLFYQELVFLAWGFISSAKNKESGNG